MKSPLHILHLEDSPGDAELIQDILETDGIVSRVTRVETQADFLTSLEQGRFDLILADYSLPSFDGISALKLALEKCPNVPFIFVSGTLGEEVAIEALKLGATDYVIKDRLSRIAPSVQRALREAEERNQRKRAEEALRQSEEQWRDVFEHNPTMYFIVDPAGIVLSVNPFGAEQLGYAVHELVGDSVLKVFYEPDREAARKKVALCLEQPGRSMSWELRKIRKNGTMLWVRETARAVRRANGPIVLVACEDITEPKRTQEQLAKTEQRLRAVIANAPIMLFALDRSGVFTLSEGKGLADLGLKPSQVVGRSVFDVYRDAPQALSAVRRALAGESFTEVVEVNDLVFETHYIPVLDGGQVAGVNGVAINVTERKRAEQELSERERRYRYIFQATGVSIWEEDFSQVKAAIDELKGRGVQDFRQYIAAHPEFVRQAISMVKVVDVNDATLKLLATESKDELLVSLEKILLPETEEVFAGELIAIAEGQTFFESETVLQTLKGDKLTVLFAITFPPEPSKLDSVLVSIMDITERKRSEETVRTIQTELAHVARVATLGELTASIAHEINQPLGAVVNNASACLRWLAAKNVEEGRRSAELIRADGHRAAEIIQRIRSFAKKTAPQKDWIDINQTVREVIALARSEMQPNGITLETRLSDDVPLILADRIQLQQVILNLIMNAVEAMSEVSDGPRQLLIRTGADISGAIVIAVRDSGPGLAPENLDCLFTPFYTTKPQGMGMGLAICRSIIEAHGGRLWATANEDRGATFQFTLPTGGETTS